MLQYKFYPFIPAVLLVRLCKLYMILWGCSKLFLYTHYIPIKFNNELDTKNIGIILLIFRYLKYLNCHSSIEFWLLFVDILVTTWKFFPFVNHQCRRALDQSLLNIFLLKGIFIIISLLKRIPTLLINPGL